MAHGTPSSLDEMPEYLRLVRGGRPPSPELVAEMQHNYNAIGGRSPLTDITLAQAAALAARLGGDIPVSVGMRNWRPFIKDALGELAASGVRRVIGIPMAPQFSTLSVQKYIDAAETSLHGLPDDLRFEPVRSFHMHPLLIDAFAERLRAAAATESELVVFTAHSLPARVIEAGDSYAGEVAATARAVASRTGIARYEVAYQSAGRTPEPWIGPDILAVLPALVAAGAAGVVVCPAGFVSDHLEVLFDLDVEARAAAAGFGLAFTRTPSPNAHPAFCAALADVIRGRA